MNSIRYAHFNAPATSEKAIQYNLRQLRLRIQNTMHLLRDTPGVNNMVRYGVLKDCLARIVECEITDINGISLHESLGR